MKLLRKFELVRLAINSIIDHDDAPVAEVVSAAQSMRDHIDRQLDAALTRRKQKQAEQQQTK